MSKIVSAFLFVLAVALLVRVGINYYARHRPVFFARAITDFNIPLDAQPLYFKEQWSDFNGNGYALSKLKFGNNEFKEIMSQTMAKGYKRLPIDTIPASDGIIDSLFTNHRTGYFVVKRLKNEISVTIIDTKAEAMVTYTTIF